MHKSLVFMLVCVAALALFGQSSSSQYQPGTIMAVKPHQSAASAPGTAQYEVSVKVGETVYLVLFTPPNGSSTVEYAAGDEFLVLVGKDTLTFNSPTTGTTAVPILSRETHPSSSTPDLSKAPGGYFSLKLQHLSEVLNLTADQQAKIKPTLEQEAGEVGEIVNNPALSQKEKLSRFQKIVNSSDEKIKPLLSQAQLGKLQDLRKEQKKDVQKILAEQKAKAS